MQHKCPQNKTYVDTSPSPDVPLLTPKWALACRASHSSRLPCTAATTKSGAPSSATMSWRSSWRNGDETWQKMSFQKNWTWKRPLCMMSQRKRFVAGGKLLFLDTFPLSQLSFSFGPDVSCFPLGEKEQRSLTVRPFWFFRSKDAPWATRTAAASKEPQRTQHILGKRDPFQRAQNRVLSVFPGFSFL